MTDLGGPICVPEMRIEPERMHPTPVEEYSKMVMARNAMLAVQARAAAAAAAGTVPVDVTDDHPEHHGPAAQDAWRQ